MSIVFNVRKAVKQLIWTRVHQCGVSAAGSGYGRRGTRRGVSAEGGTVGVGAEVRVTLKDQQQTLRGIIESFDDSSFGLRARAAGEKQTVRYVNVTLLEFTKTAYRAKGSDSSEPVTARRVAVELGIGRRVQVQTQDGKTFVGMIAKLDEKQLYLNLSASGPMNVSYATIRELKPKGLSAAKKVGIAAIAGGVVLILTVVSLTVKPPG